MVIGKQQCPPTGFRCSGLALFNNKFARRPLSGPSRDTRTSSETFFLTGNNYRNRYIVARSILGTNHQRRRATGSPRTVEATYHECGGLVREDR